MEYTMIIRQTLFAFSWTRTGRLRLRSVRFLPQSRMRKKDNLLIVEEENTRRVFVSGRTLLAELSREQVRFLAAAARFFGHLPSQESLPVWLWQETRQPADHVPGCFAEEARLAHAAL